MPPYDSVPEGAQSTNEREVVVKEIKNQLNTLRATTVHVEANDEKEKILTMLSNVEGVRTEKLYQIADSLIAIDAIAEGNPQALDSILSKIKEIFNEEPEGVAAAPEAMGVSLTDPNTMTGKINNVVTKVTEFIEKLKDMLGSIDAGTLAMIESIFKDSPTVSNILREAKNGEKSITLFVVKTLAKNKQSLAAQEVTDLIASLRESLDKTEKSAELAALFPPYDFYTHVKDALTAVTSSTVPEDVTKKILEKGEANITIVMKRIPTAAIAGVPPSPAGTAAAQPVDTKTPETAERPKEEVATKAEFQASIGDKKNITIEKKGTQFFIIANDRTAVISGVSKIEIKKATAQEPAEIIFTMPNNTIPATVKASDIAAAAEQEGKRTIVTSQTDFVIELTPPTPV